MEQPDAPAMKELFEKAVEYEPMADWLLKNGKALAYSSNEIQLEAPYSEQNPFHKFKLLTDVYGPEEYATEEMIDYVAEILDEPENYQASQKWEKARGGVWQVPLDNGDLPGDYPEVESEEVRSHKTGKNPGEPEMRKVVRRLETEEDGEWIEMDFVDSRR